VRNRQLAAAFETWQAVAAGLEADGFTLKRAIMKMTQAKLSAAFRAWRVTADQMKRAAHTTSGAIKRMLNRKLSAAFEAWQATAAQMAAEAAALRKALMKMTQAKLSAALGTWRVTAVESKHTAHTTSALRMRNRQLSAAFEKWQAVAAQMRNEALALKRAIMKMAYPKMVNAFQSWRTVAANETCMVSSDRDAGSGGLPHLPHTACVMWERWKTFAVWEKVLGVRARQACVEMRGYGMEIALLSWLARTTPREDYAGCWQAEKRRSEEKPAEGLSNARTLISKPQLAVAKEPRPIKQTPTPVVKPDVPVRPVVPPPPPASSEGRRHSVERLVWDDDGDIVSREPCAYTSQHLARQPVIIGTSRFANGEGGMIYESPREGNRLLSKYMSFLTLDRT